MIKIPCGKYAVFTSEKGNYAGDELKKMHDLIFNSWLKESKYSIKKEYIIEVLHLATDRAKRRKERYYEIYVPLTESEPVIYDDSKLTIRLAKVDDYKDIC